MTARSLLASAACIALAVAFTVLAFWIAATASPEGVGGPRALAFLVSTVAMIGATGAAFLFAGVGADG